MEGTCESIKSRVPAQEKNEYYVPNFYSLSSAEGYSGFALYFTVDDIEAIVKDLKKKGVKFKDGISNNPFGKFATLLVPEGNRLIL